MKIVEFLEARIAEDEAVGKRIVDGPHRGHWIHLQDMLGTINRNCPDCMTVVAGSRWLAECKAKRELLALVDDISGNWFSLDQARGMSTDPKDDDPGDLMLLALVRVYADHPDFDPEWAVTA